MGRGYTIDRRRERLCIWHWHSYSGRYSPCENGRFIDI